ncbi:hypothetical protein LTR67_006381 [Exophiala xenobiotica]
MTNINLSDADTHTADCALPDQGNAETSPNQDDIRFLIHPSDKIDILEPPSTAVQDLISSKMVTPTCLTDSEKDSQFNTSLLRLLRESKVVGKSPIPSRRMVVKCNVHIVAKLVWGAEDFTEHTTLRYLLEHKPNLPVSKPLGLLRMGPVLMTFMSYLPGTTLDAKWAGLSVDQKSSVCEQLDAIFGDLRTLRFANGVSLGGVGGQGCKDQRRHLRRNSGPILNVEEFVDFQFSNPNYGSSTFIEFLRAFTRVNAHQIVFTHGDLRPENILVEVTEDTKCTVTGLIDWEDSGFYPEYYESTKLTNCMGTTEEWDWLRFLPPCISPHKFPVEWLLDYVWGRHLE